MSKSIKIKKIYNLKKDSKDKRDLKFVPNPKKLTKLPPKVDLRPNFPPAYHQGSLGSCVANAIAGAIQFDRLKNKQKPSFIPSRLFLYYNLRVLQNSVKHDSGGSIRNGIKAYAKYGTCPESLEPYNIAKFKSKPSADCYINAANYRPIKYQAVLKKENHLKACLASGYPICAGIVFYEKFESPEVAKSGHVPMPKDNEKCLGGHAVLIVGYDDSKQHFIVRNSWGPKWGQKGYFTLPYQYVLSKNLTQDLWQIDSIED